MTDTPNPSTIHQDGLMPDAPAGALAGDPSHSVVAVVRFAIPYEIPSQNVRDRWHWRKRHSDLGAALLLVRSEVSKCSQLNARGRVVTLTLVSYRSRLITDDANLRGGAKGLVDALVRAGVLVDDSDTWCRLRYRQAVLSEMPLALIQAMRGRRPCTQIEVEAPV